MAFAQADFADGFAHGDAHAAGSAKGGEQRRGDGDYALHDDYLRLRAQAFDVEIEHAGEDVGQAGRAEAAQGMAIIRARMPNSSE